MFLGILAILVLCILASGAVFYFLICEGKIRDKKKSEENDLNGQISKLKGELQASREALKKEELNKNGLDAKIQELNAQLEKSNKDLSSTTRMYEGLKEQYNEIEGIAEKLRQDLNNKSPDVKIDKPLNEQIKEENKGLLEHEE